MVAYQAADVELTMEYWKARAIRAEERLKKVTEAHALRPPTARHRASTSLDSQCAQLLHSYLNISRRQPCPSTPKDKSPTYKMTFHHCAMPPSRPCVDPVPTGAADPTESRLWNPAPGLVDWNSSFPRWRGERGPSWEPLANRRFGDCVTCWRFAVDKAHFTMVVKQLKKWVPFGAPLVQTALDLGAGAGGFLAAVKEAHGVTGLGISRDWQNLPYVETMAARGVLAIELDIFRRLPMPNGAFDMVFSSWSALLSPSRDAVDCCGDPFRNTSFPCAIQSMQNFIPSHT